MSENRPWTAYDQERVRMAEKAAQAHGQELGNNKEEDLTNGRYDLALDCCRAMRQAGWSTEEIIRNLLADLDEDPPVLDQLR